jgi:2'-5' RNA ligase
MFAAVVPPPAAVRDLAAALEGLGDTGGLRWTTHEQWHLTLAFLPAVDPRALEDLVERLRRAAARRVVVQASVAGAGAFPSPRRARVLWAGVAAEGSGDGEQLRRLAAGCRAAATRARVDVADGRFTPHLTLARLPRPGDVTATVQALDAYRGPAWPVDAVHLVASHLGKGPGGRPRYETIASFAVGAASR